MNSLIPDGRYADEVHLPPPVRVALQAARIGIWDWDLRTGTIVYSELAKRICGFPPDRPVTFQQVSDVTDPEDLPRTSAMARRALDPAIREQKEFRYRIRRASDGAVRWVEAYGEAIFQEIDGREQAVRYVGTLKDITDEKLADDALAESEATLRLAMDAAEMAIWDLDLATGTLKHSPELNRICGFPADASPTVEELRARYAPGERERIQEEGAQAMARGEMRFQSDFRYLWPNGAARWLRLRCQFAPSQDGSRRRVIGILYDITDSKESEQRLELLADELNHRSKNTLAIIQTIAKQTFRETVAIDAALKLFNSRLRALAIGNDLALKGSTSDAPLREVILSALTPFQPTDRDAFELDGPDVGLPAKRVAPLALAINELATNASKYGALSSAMGRVRISWELCAAGSVTLDWRETGGPPVIPPERRGFGSRLLERGLFRAANDRVRLDYPASGFTCRIELDPDG
ncbi:HWE histidine kinase domain-containing protein [Aquibium sp. LZ166]|uniref:Blue-light-activated histidine kinase n=1 Tax=Aquibium pacificus TaxID=3153579 RepID=A0ABV3SH08_9HYPH